ncbi:MAG: response regulator [Lachnospiraceae bacterium]
MIFMDIMMPDMSGYETTRQIRAMADMKKAGIRIIAMTQMHSGRIAEQRFTPG